MKPRLNGYEHSYIGLWVDICLNFPWVKTWGCSAGPYDWCMLSYINNLTSLK